MNMKRTLLFWATCTGMFWISGKYSPDNTFFYILNLVLYGVTYFNGIYESKEKADNEARSRT